MDKCNPTRIDTEYMWNKIEQKFPSTQNEETYSWYGKGLPAVPCIEYFNDGTDLLIITPEQATSVLKKYMENMEKSNDDSVILYEDALPDLSSDCFDIMLDQVNIYVLENDGIIEQSEDEKRHKYEEYKKTVLECIDKGLGFNYEEIVNDDLRNDEDFILKLEKSLKKDEDIEWAEDIREQIGIKDKIDPTKESQDFKDEIVDMTRDGFSVNVDSLNQMSKNIEDLVLTESKEDRKQRG